MIKNGIYIQQYSIFDINSVAIGLMNNTYGYTNIIYCFI